ncbi:MAG TPA: TonB-dependent receptor [Nevskiaceae bacterium]|nr:TonB-dependent receptor [Nevskiaceae bacterium]
MNRIARAVATAFPLSVFTCAAWAAAPPSAPGSTDAALNPVTVTATRTPVPLADALSQTIVITRQQIENSAATSVVEVLRQYAGLEISQTGGPGQSTSLYVRGANANQTVIMINGIRVADHGLGVAPLQNISPEMIERIEVVEGPRSTLYGADAIGGVVNIITRKPGPGQLEVVAGGGSYDTTSGALAVRNQGKLAGHKWGVAFNAQQQHAGGFPTMAGATGNSQYRNRTLNGQADIDLGRVQLQARAWDSTGYNAFYSNPTTPKFDDFHDQILAFEARAKVTDTWTSSLTFSHSENQFDQPGQPIHVTRPEADWHNVITAGRHNRVSFGARMQNARISEVVTGGVTNLHRNLAEDYGYVQDEANYGRNHAVMALSYLHNGQFGERFNWNFSYGYDLFTHTRLIASAGSAFHAPTLVDLYFPSFGFGPTSNPNLKPEKAIDYELAVRQQLTPAQSVELRLFRTDVRDLILLDTAFVPQNIARAQLQGVQLNWRYVDADWTARVGAIYQNPRDRTNHRTLSRRARWSASASVDRRLGRFDVGAAVYSTDQRPDDTSDAATFAPVRMIDGGYALFDLHAGVHLTRRLSLQAHVQNVFNHHYTSARFNNATPYNEAGAAVYGTLRYTLPL